MRVRYFAVLALAAVCAGQAQAQAAACRRGCSPLDANCKRLEADCMVKLNGYNAYMAQMAAGAQYYPLPRKYIDLLQPRYPNVDLTTVRFALAHRQLSEAVTDCHSIYFIDPVLVGRLRDGTLTAADSVLYHELRHAEQCDEAGGREAYAVMWWEDVAATGGNPATIHSRQPMENSARSRATAVSNAFPDGLIPPVSLSAITASPDTFVPMNTPITWTATASGGTGATEFRFIVTRESSDTFEGTDFTANREFRYYPTVEGAHRLRVEARQASPRRSAVRRDTTFFVGPGGAPFAITCPAGNVLVGIEVRTAARVNAVQPVCASVEGSGAWKVRGMTRTQTIYWISFAAWTGGSGGTLHSLRCQPGSGVSEVSGIAESGVRGLGIRCARLAGTAGGVVTRDSTSSPGVAGGTAGVPFTLRCPEGQVATGLTGRAGAIVNLLAGLRCATLRP